MRRRPGDLLSPSRVGIKNRTLERRRRSQEKAQTESAREGYVFADSSP